MLSGNNSLEGEQLQINKVKTKIHIVLQELCQSFVIWTAGHELQTQQKHVILWLQTVTFC